METDIGKWIIEQELDEEKALLCLKWLIVENIDGNWGAGDKHLFMLKILMALDPDDKVIKELYDRLVEYKALIEKDNPNIKREQYVELLYRDEGQDEAKYYAKIIKEKYGEEFFDKLLDVYWL